MVTQYIQRDHIQIKLAETKSQAFEIQTCANTLLHMQAGEHINTNVLITYTGENAHIDCEIEIAKDAHVNILFWNKLDGVGKFRYHIILQEDAQAYIGFGDLQASSSTYTVKSNLQKSGSNLHLRSVCFANQKHITMDIVHESAHSSALMENFAIVKDKGDYVMKASGVIKKGAYGSSSHQASRVLTLSQNQRSEVVPVLLIDENDVKASHATTLGQPDENQLYYLCSRGLSRQDAIGLLTMGYLMPISEVLDDMDFKQQIQNEIEEKVIRND